MTDNELIEWCRLRLGGFEYFDEENKWFDRLIALARIGAAVKPDHVMVPVARVVELARACEMQANIMRDKNRTKATGAVAAMCGRVADAFDRTGRKARAMLPTHNSTGE